MAVNTQAFFLTNPVDSLQDGGISIGAMHPETQPAILWGQGTPDGDRAPFNVVNKGSIYMQTNATDDTPAVWYKVDEGGANDDWALGGSYVIVTSALFDISAAASEQVLFHAVAAAKVIEAGIIWNEATGASGAAEGDITIGVATGGAEIVAAASYGVSKATGTYDALTIVDGEVAAGESVFASHDQAAGADGTYFLQLKILLYG